MDDDKHEIFARIMRENYRGMTKSALYHVIGLSKYVLIDFNWNLNVQQNNYHSLLYNQINFHNPNYQQHWWN